MTGVRRDCTCPRARHEHGTRRAWEADHCRCLPCRAAHANARRTYRAGGTWREAYIPACGTVRRLQALAAAGITKRQIAAHTGMSGHMISYLRRGVHQQVTPEIATLIRAAYEALWDKVTLDADSRRCSTLARSYGWLPPMAWDDDLIDDPSYTPSASETVPVLDEIAVERAVAGRPVHLTREEKREAWRRLEAAGLSARVIGQRLNVSTRSVQRRRAA